MAPVSLSQKILAGVFVLLALLVWIYMSITLEGPPSGQKYHIFIKDPVKGLAPSSPVYYNGIPVGKVIEIRNNFEANSVRVDILITKPGVKIFADLKTENSIIQGTRACLKMAWVTGIQHIDLTGGTNIHPILENSKPIPTIKSFMMTMTKSSHQIMENLATFTSPERLEKVHNLVSNMEKITANLNQTMFSSDKNSIKSRIQKILGNLENFTGQANQNHIRKTLENISKLTDPEKAKWSLWMKKITEDTSRVLNRSEKLLEDIHMLMHSKNGKDDIASVVKNINKMLQENRKNLRKIFHNFRKLSSNALRQMNRITEDTQEVMQNLNYLLNKEIPQTNRELQKSLKELSSLLKILKAKPNALLWGSQVKGQ